MSRFRWSAIRVVSLAPFLILAALILVGVGAGVLSSRVQAANGSQSGYLFQDDYPPVEDPPTPEDYPAVPTIEGYPAAPTDTALAPVDNTPTQAVTDTPVPGETPLPTDQPTATVPAPPTQQAGASPTPATQQVIPTVTETLVETPTVPGLLTRPAVTLTPTPQPSGGIDWGLFWIGFSIPVLGASGVVLYLLDRQPMLLQRRGKKP